MTTHATEGTLGRELRLSLEGCSSSWLDNEQAVLDSVEQICEKLQVEVRSLTTHSFEPQGVSVVAILAESHVAIHTWPEAGLATVDIFTCGEVDPLDVVPDVTRMTSAQGSRIEVSTREAAAAPEATTYPGYPEYILMETPHGHFAPPEFRRGVGREYILDAEAVSWQKYFSGPDYSPPRGQDILLLHPCAWAKPYDMSSFVTRLRSVTDKFERIHRVVVSNVGVVPYEYQMNPYFCSYDYNHVGPDLTEEVAESHSEAFRSITAQRITQYIQAHSGQYKAVVLLGHPTNLGYQAAVQKASRSESLPGFRAPSVEVYRHARNETKSDRDIDAALFADVSLRDLETNLRGLIAHIGDSRPQDSGESSQA